MGKAASQKEKSKGRFLLFPLSLFPLPSSVAVAAPKKSTPAQVFWLNLSQSLSVQFRLQMRIKLAIWSGGFLDRCDACLTTFFCGGGGGGKGGWGRGGSVLRLTHLKCPVDRLDLDMDNLLLSHFQKKIVFLFLPFRRKLNRVQWASLLILFLSIVSLSNEKKKLHREHQRIIRDILPTEVDWKDNKEDTNICWKLRRTSESPNITVARNENFGTFRIGEEHILVMVQCVLASSANIYNEKIFKEGGGMDDSILLQNTKLYMFGVFFNTATLFLRPEFRSHALNCGLLFGYNGHATLLIVVTAFFGLTVALILKFRDNMFQVMSNQLTNVVMITASVLFLDFHPTLRFFLTAPVVLLAIFIFNAGGIKERVDPLLD